MDGADKQAVQEMIPLFKEKFGKELTEIQMAGIMKDGEKTFRALYNPAEIDTMFKKPGELYRFIKTNIDGMDANGIDEVLTGNGLGIKRNVFLGMSKDDFSSIANLLPIKNMVATTDQDIKRQALAIKEIQIKTDEINAFAEGRGLYNETKLDSKLIKNSPEYVIDLARVKRQIQDIKLLKDSDITAEALSNLDDAVFNMQSKYGVDKNQGMITLIDTANSKHEFRISIEDFKSLDGMENKNFMDLVKDGKVTVKDGSSIIKKGDYRIKMQLDVAADKYRNNFIKREIDNDIPNFLRDRIAQGFKSEKSISVIQQDIHGSILNLMK